MKALRHYHEVDLLVPASIDAESGYREYGISQVPTAQVIRRLRDLGMPLDKCVSGMDARLARGRRLVEIAPVVGRSLVCLGSLTLDYSRTITAQLKRKQVDKKQR